MRFLDRRSTSRNDKPERRDFASRERWLEARIAELRIEIDRLDAIEATNAAKRASFLEAVSA